VKLGSVVGFFQEKPNNMDGQPFGFSLPFFFFFFFSACGEQVPRVGINKQVGFLCHVVFFFNLNKPKRELAMEKRTRILMYMADTATIYR
jgi:hypothetical protein